MARLKMLSCSKWVLGIQLILLTVSLSYGQSIQTCEVVRVIDGDTISCLTDKKDNLRIRLANIDAPEAKQPWGNKARQKLAELIFRKKVIIDIQNVDRYGRYIAVIYLGSLNINNEMVLTGNAWVYKYFNKDKTLPLLEQQAKNNKVGLWNLPKSEIVRPWEWRRNKPLHNN